jgi:hypothetical protein
MMPVTATVTVTKTQRDSDRDSGSESNHSDIPKQLEPLRLSRCIRLGGVRVAGGTMIPTNLSQAYCGPGRWAAAATAAATVTVTATVTVAVAATGSVR